MRMRYCDKCFQNYFGSVELIEGRTIVWSFFGVISVFTFKNSFFFSDFSCYFHTLCFLIFQHFWNIWWICVCCLKKQFLKGVVHVQYWSSIICLSWWSSIVSSCCLRWQIFPCPLLKFFSFTFWNSQECPISQNIWCLMKTQ